MLPYQRARISEEPAQYFDPLGLVELLHKSRYNVCNFGFVGVVVAWRDCFRGTRVFRGVKGKERVPVPVAGPAFRGGVKFVIFYVFGSFLQPSAQIDPVQRSFPPVSDTSLKRERERETGDASKDQRVEATWTPVITETDCLEDVKYLILP